MVAGKGVGSHPRQKFLGKEFALLDRYELQDALVDTLKKTKYCYRVRANPFPCNHFPNDVFSICRLMH